MSLEENEGIVYIPCDSENWMSSWVLKGDIGEMRDNCYLMAEQKEL